MQLNLSDLTVRLLSPAHYRFAPQTVQAVQVQGFMLADNVVDFSVFKNPKYRSVVENDFLQLNDVIVGFSALDPGSEREITSVGIYHSAFPFSEPVTLAPRTMAFRAANLREAASILAGLIYRLHSRRNLQFSEIRAMPITLLTDEQVSKFLDLVKEVHELRKMQREVAKTLQKLIPAIIHKFFKNNAEVTIG